MALNQLKVISNILLSLEFLSGYNIIFIDLGVDINVGMENNDNLIEDINKNYNLEEEYEINK